MSGGGTDFEAKPALNPTALPVADAARLLSAAGADPATPEKGDVSSNLLNYGA